MAANYVASAGITTAFHPLGYAKVLIQLGHEPLDPVLTRTWFGFGREKFCYPNIIKYVGHIYRTDGFFGLYRGLGSRIIGGFVGSYVDKVVSMGIKAQTTEETKKDDSNDELIVWLKLYVKQSSEEAISKCCGIIASHPFHVIMIRQMAQFIGGETEYSSIWSSLGEIYRNDGILGYFSGLVPRLIGEILLIYVSNFLGQLFNKYFVEDKELQTYFSAGFGLLCGQFTYPFQLVSNVMAVNNSGLAVSRFPYMDNYNSWWGCWGSLKSKDQCSRGSSMFFRYMKGNNGISSTVFVAGQKKY